MFYIVRRRKRKKPVFWPLLSKLNRRGKTVESRFRPEQPRPRMVTRRRVLRRRPRAAQAQAPGRRRGGAAAHLGRCAHLRCHPALRRHVRVQRAALPYINRPHTPPARALGNGGLAAAPVLASPKRANSSSPGTHGHRASLARRSVAAKGGCRASVAPDWRGVPINCRLCQPPGA